MVSFTLNGEPTSLEIDPDTPLLWAIRDHLNMTGTKFGCGISLCGACTVHVDGVAVRSCQFPVADLDGAQVRTIEGLGGPEPDGAMHAVQQAWIDEEVPQCGYCQPGMIMAAAAFLAENPDPTEADINAGITNICRCGTYTRIRRAIQRAAAQLREDQASAL